MPQFERRLYEPSDDMRAFDAGEDDFEEEGSRLPLLIVIALVVLASFGGVVWLAYTQGVQRGRDSAPRIIAAQPSQKMATAEKNPYAGLNIYKPAKPADEDLNNDTAPPRSVLLPSKATTAAPAVPTATKPAMTKAKPAVAPANVKAAVNKPPVLTQKTAPPAAKPSTQKSPPAQIAPTPSRVATAAPRIIAPPASLAPPPKASTRAKVPSTAKTTTAEKLSPVETPAAKPAPQTAALNPSAAKTIAGTQQPEVHAGGYVLQIGSYKSDVEANASWQAYKAAHPSVAGYAPDVHRAELGAKGTWYRLRVGPFASLSEANAACAKLKASGGNCFPAKR